MFGQRRRGAAPSETPNESPMPAVPAALPIGFDPPIRRGMKIPTPEELARIDQAARNQADALRKKRDDEAQRRQQAQLAWARHRDTPRARVSDLRGQAGESVGRVYLARNEDDLAAAAKAEAERQVLLRCAQDAQRELDAWQRTQAS